MHRHKILIELELDHPAAVLQDHPMLPRLEMHLQNFWDRVGSSPVTVGYVDAVWVESEDLNPPPPRKRSV